MTLFFTLPLINFNHLLYPVKISSVFSTLLKSIGLFDLKWHRTDRSVDDIKVPREPLKSIWYHQLSKRSRGTLMSSTDQSVPCHFKFNTPDVSLNTIELCWPCPSLPWIESDEQSIDMCRFPYSTTPNMLTRQPSRIHHNNKWIFKDIQAYNLLLLMHSKIRRPFQKWQMYYIHKKSP